jgi:tetratricopeptide (TPR) repeat protein
MLRIFLVLLLFFFSQLFAVENSVVEEDDSLSLEKTLKQAPGKQGLGVSVICRFDTLFSSTPAEEKKPQEAGEKKKSFHLSAWDLAAEVFSVQAPSSFPVFVLKASDDVFLKTSSLKRYEVLKIEGFWLPGDKPMIEIVSLKPLHANLVAGENLVERVRLSAKLFEKNNAAAAVEELQRCSLEKTDPYLRAQVLSLYGQALSRNGQRRKGVAFLYDSLDLFPRSATAITLSKELLLLKRPRDAETLLLEMIDRWPKEARLRLALARVYQSLSQNRRLCHQLELAIEADPALPQSYLFLARTLAVSKKENKKAIALLHRGLENIDHDQGDLHLLLGDLYFQEKRYDNASFEFEMAKRKLPENPEVYIKAARAQVRRGSKYHPSAVVNFRQALRFNSLSPKIRFELAQLFFQDKNYAFALEESSILLEKQAKNPLYLVFAALCHERLGQFEAAIRKILKARKIEDSPYHDWHLAYLFCERKNYRQALKYYERAFQALPEAAQRRQAAVYLGALYLLEDRKDETRELLEHFDVKDRKKLQGKINRLKKKMRKIFKAGEKKTVKKTAT